MKRVARALDVLAGASVVLGGLGIVLFMLSAAGVALEAGGTSVPLAGAAPPFFLRGGVVLFVGGIGLLTVANVLAWRAWDEDDLHAADGEPANRPERIAELYRHSLQRTYLGLACFTGVLVAVSIAGVELPEGGGQVGDVLESMLSIAIPVLFGNLRVAVAATVVMLALWLGLRAGSAEALLASFVVAAQFLLSTLLAGTWGLGPAAVWLVYVSIRARKATTFQLADPTAVPRRVREFVE